MKKKILIIEDDENIVEMIEYNLNKEGFITSVARSGEESIKKISSVKPDLILLDLMLPDMDGFEVCRQIKKNNDTCHIPIIMLTAKSEEIDKVTGLELGADDYVTKPFSIKELVTRIKVRLRGNIKNIVTEKLARGIISIDSEKHKVFVSGKEIFLTSTEFKILKFMAERPGVVFSRDRLLDAVFGYESAVYDRTVDVHIKSLRKKLDKARDYVETVRGIGYRFKE